MKGSLLFRASGITDFVLHPVRLHAAGCLLYKVYKKFVEESSYFFAAGARNFASSIDLLRIKCYNTQAFGRMRLHTGSALMREVAIERSVFPRSMSDL